MHNINLLKLTKIPQKNNTSTTRTVKYFQIASALINRMENMSVPLPNYAKFYMAIMRLKSFLDLKNKTEFLKQPLEDFESKLVVLDLDFRYDFAL